MANIGSSLGGVKLLPLSSAAKQIDVTSEVVITKITLTPNKSYRDLELFISTSSKCLARIIVVEDVTVTDVLTKTLIPGIFLGPGSNTFSEIFDKIGQFTAGSTGILEMQLLARSIGPPNNIYASLGINEIQ